MTDVAADAVFVLEEDATQQSEGQIIAGHEKEAAQACTPRYVDDLRYSRDDCTCNTFTVFAIDDLTIRPKVSRNSNKDAR